MNTLDQEPLAPLGGADYQLLFDRSPLPIWVYGVQTLRMIEANQSALALYGYDRESFMRLRLPDLQPEDGLAALRENFEPHGVQRTVQRRWHRHHSGARIDLEILEQDLMFGGIQARLVTAHRLATVRESQTAADMQQSQQQLSELAHQLMTQERTLVKGLRQALHDKLGQTLAAIRMAHETALNLQENQAAVMPPEVAVRQAQMGTLIGQAVAEVRQVLADLWPALLEEKGFIAALEIELMKRSVAQPKVRTSFHVENEAAGARWPAEVEYAAFMVAREALENATQDSCSNPVSVRLSSTAGALQFELTHQGVGDGAAPDHKLRQPGIFGMHEWARIIGAVLTVDSVAQQGKRVSFSWRRTP
jgi:PAS domain S-box-containing protein